MESESHNTVAGASPSVVSLPSPAQQIWVLLTMSLLWCTHFLSISLLWCSYLVTVSPSEAHLCDPSIAESSQKPGMLSLPKRQPYPHPRGELGVGAARAAGGILLGTKMKHQVPKEEGECRTSPWAPARDFSWCQAVQAEAPELWKMLWPVPPPVPGTNPTGTPAGFWGWHWCCLPALFRLCSELTAMSLCQQDRLSVHKNGLVSAQSWHSMAPSPTPPTVPGTSLISSPAEPGQQAEPDRDH